jgi:hypothetical protein
MANQSKLKAWVRYDGTGRVISGGPIFQVNKPKVGNWKQIDANLCCNGSTPTTTTTTTSGGGGVTPTAFIQNYWTSATSSCINSPEGTQVFYSASTTLSTGSFVFQDAALTIPVTVGWVIRIVLSPGIYTNYLVGTGGVLTQFYCQDNFYFGTTPQIACSQNSPAELLPVATNTPTINNGTIVYAFLTSRGYSVGQTVYMRFSPGYAATVAVLVTSATTGTVVSETTACPLPVLTVTNQRWGNTAGDACGNVNPATTFYTTGPLEYGSYLQNGNVIYLDAALTQPVQYPYIVSPGVTRLLDCSNGVLSNQRNC